MTAQDELASKIKQVVDHAQRFNDEQFRLVLEGLIKKGGKDAEMMLIHYFTSDKVPAETRENIIRSTGYIRSSHYLIPLKKIIDQEPRLPLKKAAVLALSKYNNQRALNILNSALQSIKNPYLMKTINEQISKIKKNNPILGLLPRFLKGDEDFKGFMVVLDILKKLLKPPDATFFVNYLRHDNPSIRMGSFELLCYTGDRSHQQHILEYFYGRLQPAEGQEGADGDEALSLLKHVREFFVRFPSLILTQMGRLTKLYSQLQDIKVKKIIISIFCRSRATHALNFIKEIYGSGDADIREFILEESAGNEEAVDFLFEKYQAGQILKENVVKALLNSLKGFEYFAGRFEEFEPEGQELIVKSLPEIVRPQMVGFIKKLLQAGLPHVRVHLLKRARYNFLYSLQDVLFDSEREDGFYEVEDEYLDTISLLFPVTTVHKLIEKISTSDLEVKKAKRYFNRLIDVTQRDIVVTIPDHNTLELLILKVVNASSLSLNKLLLTFFEQLKTLDRTTYKNLYDAYNSFTVQRGDNLIEEENHGLKRVRENFQNIIEDIKRIDSLEKEIRMILAKTVPDLNQLRRTIETYHIGAAFKIKPMLKLMAEFLNQVDEKALVQWRAFFKGFPILTQLMREERMKLANPKAETKSGGSYHDKLRIVICFEEQELNALFKDQVQNLLPGFKVTVNEKHLQPTDILLADPGPVKEMMNNNTLHAKRIFLFLESRTEYSTFKALNPKTFKRPISVYKIVKLILQEIYLIR
jgi:hypothetical protein